jgi:hypothetical protein
VVVHEGNKILLSLESVTRLDRNLNGKKKAVAGMEAILSFVVQLDLNVLLQIRGRTGQGTHCNVELPHHNWHQLSVAPSVEYLQSKQLF